MYVVSCLIPIIFGSRETTHRSHQIKDSTTVKLKLIFSSLSLCRQLIVYLPFGNRPRSNLNAVDFGNC